MNQTLQNIQGTFSNKWQLFTKKNHHFHLCNITFFFFWTISE